MDKNEQALRIKEFKNAMAEKHYDEASKIADLIDVKKVDDNNLLTLIADAYELSHDYELAKDVLLLAYERTNAGRHLAYRLCLISIKTKSYDEAEDFYNDFILMAPKDTSRYVLQYKIVAAQNAPKTELIKILEEYVNIDMEEKWAYELAKLYKEVGENNKCVEVCDEIGLWFPGGKYLARAMELKKQISPLNITQQQLLDDSNTKETSDDNYDYEEEETNEAHQTDSLVKAIMDRQGPRERYEPKAIDEYLDEEERGASLDIEEATKKANETAANPINEFAKKTFGKFAKKTPETDSKPETEKPRITDDIKIENNFNVDLGEEVKEYKFKRDRFPKPADRSIKEITRTSADGDVTHNATANIEDGEIKYEKPVQFDITEIKLAEPEPKKSENLLSARVSGADGNKFDVFDSSNFKKESNSSDIKVKERSDVFTKQRALPDKEPSVIDDVKAVEDILQSLKERGILGEDTVEKAVGIIDSDETYLSGIIEPDEPEEQEKPYKEEEELYTAELDIEAIREAAKEDSDDLNQEDAGAEESSDDLVREKDTEENSDDLDEVIGAEELEEIVPVHENEEAGQTIIFGDELGNAPSELTDESGNTRELDVNLDTITFSEDDEVAESIIDKKELEDDLVATDDVVEEDLVEEETIPEETVAEEVEEPVVVQEPVIKSDNSAHIEMIKWEEKVEEEPAEEESEIENELAEEPKTELVEEPKNESEESDANADIEEEKPEDDSNDNQPEADLEESEPENELEADSAVLDELVVDDTPIMDMIVTPTNDEVEDLDDTLQGGGDGSTIEIPSNDAMGSTMEVPNVNEATIVVPDVADETDNTEESEVDGATVIVPDLSEMIQKENEEPKAEDTTEEVPKEEIVEDDSTEDDNASEEILAEEETSEDEDVADYGDELEEMINGESKGNTEEIKFELDAEDMEGFDSYLNVEGLENKIKKVIENLVVNFEENGNSAKGNVVIVGDEKTGKTTMAIEIIKLVNKKRGRLDRRVAKIDAISFNSKSFDKVARKLKSCDLIIEDAHLMTDTTLENMIEGMKHYTDDMIVVLEGETKQVKKMFETVPSMKNVFDNVIAIKQYNIKEWVAFGKNMAKEQGFVIDDMAELAFYKAIDDTFGKNKGISQADVEQIVEKAIAKRSKFKLFGTKKDSEGLKILEESDFN